MGTIEIENGHGYQYVDINHDALYLEYIDPIGTDSLFTRVSIQSVLFGNDILHFFRFEKP